MTDYDLYLNSCEGYTIDIEAFIQYSRNKQRRKAINDAFLNKTVHQALKIIHGCTHADTVSMFECDGKISQGIKVTPDSSIFSYQESSRRETHLLSH